MLEKNIIFIYLFSLLCGAWLYGSGGPGNMSHTKENICVVCGRKAKIERNKKKYCSVYCHVKDKDQQSQITKFLKKNT